MILIKKSGIASCSHGMVYVLIYQGSITLAHAIINNNINGKRREKTFEILMSYIIRMASYELSLREIFRISLG